MLTRCCWDKWSRKSERITNKSFSFTWSEVLVGLYNNKITISKETPPSSILHQLTLTKGDCTEKKDISFSKKRWYFALPVVKFRGFCKVKGFIFLGQNHTKTIIVRPMQLDLQGFQILICTVLLLPLLPTFLLCSSSLSYTTYNIQATTKKNIILQVHLRCFTDFFSDTFLLTSSKMPVDYSQSFFFTLIPSSKTCKSLL